MSYIDRTKGALYQASMSEKVLLGATVVGLFLPVVLQPYLAFLAAQYYLFSLMALSLGLLWGYVGILSFGQAAFFGLGAYVMAWSFKYTFVPGLNPAYVALVLAPLVTGAIAAILGWFLFYSDVKDVYFVIITLALSVILEQLAVSVSSIFGGFNGIYLPRMAVSIPGVFSYQLANDRVFYYVAFAALVGGYALCRRIVRSDFGETLLAIKENEERTKSLGYNTARYKTQVFTVSGALAGIAGALYATLSQFVSPPLTGFVLSTEVVIWVAVGGRNLLLGAITGGLLVNAASTGLSSALADRYILILGLIFIAVVVTFKKGVVGYLAERYDWGEKL
ncbi:branched-chain amino acid ABC transporter permease [Haloplanus aerogenes]|uniref:Branched-chain amino acid ABC transporter permease n=1 Tax=Haloplanus aerogenes TaxID=660522 RepID=A0A3M0DX77_9EURY|nr:branched-chain amino acid ABC transporter permease [Haloplanus aerogenes]AZH24205.1 branched-chain amino acid ABC transporter permease [Haloplanus aerogenes]RMB24169.1 branched-chain amino acid transport system permease protein/urea transport system permease protein [Haloplanus aerogenes]